MNPDISNTINFSDFVVHNFPWFILLFILILFYCYYEFKTVSVASYHVSVKVAVNLVNDKNIQVVDIRSESEFKKGHIANSRNLSIDELSQNLKKYFRNIDTVFLLVGDKNHSSDKAAIMLKNNGYKKIKILSAGMKAWIKDQMPIEKGVDVSNIKSVKGAVLNKKKKKSKK